MNMICEENTCYGCGLCVAECPMNAISMRESEITGHFKPIINTEKCIDCGRCVEKCPYNQSIEFYENIRTFAAYRKNAEEQIGSSSGGVAAALYEVAIDNDWYVAGTYMNEDFNTEMILTNSREDITKFKGSKYVQANTKSVYKELKKTLNKGINVLFIGTPCQCQAARIAVGNKNESLITVDLICHGVPSQKIFKQYIKWVEEQKNRIVRKVSFRSPWGEEMIMNDGKRDIWKRRMYWDPYLEAFSIGIINNECCYQCPFAQDKRASDLTIGDFWGIGTSEPFEDPKRKISVIGVNTKRGEKLLTKCNSLVLIERKWDEAVAGNAQLQSALNKSDMYNLFWDTYLKAGLDEAFKATIYDSVSKKYKKEYPKTFIKSSVKKIIKNIISVY